MLRWCLSIVRALGGHDANPSFFNSRTLRLSSSRSIRASADATIPVAKLLREPGPPLMASSPVDPESIEARDAGTSVWSPTSLSPIHNLKLFLSLENVASDRPLVYSPTTIRSLYYRAESRNQLGMLDSSMLTRLIGLFGSLSIEPRVVAYGDPLASRCLELSARRTHWAFVLKVGRYKLARGMCLQDSDRFWLMHAELAIVQARPPLEPLSCDAYGAILRARKHYHIIRRHSRRPEVHSHYLEKLLAIGGPRLLDFAACDLAFLLRHHRVLHHQLQRLLYRLVIRHGSLLSTRSQDAILDALWRRSSHGTGGASDDVVPDDAASHITADHCILDPPTIARFLSSTLFGFASSLPNDRSTNWFGHLFSVFSPGYELPLRWSSLIVFSIFNSAEMLRFTGIHGRSGHAVPHVTSCWQVIFGLAAVEKIISQGRPSTLAMQATSAAGVLEATRALYELWMPVVKSSLASRDLACVAATSFLRIASILADVTLFRDSQYLYVEDCSDVSPVPWTSVQKPFFVQYVAAAVRVQGPRSDVAFRALEALSPEQQQQVLASAVEALASIDVSLAHTLYIVAQEKGMELDPGVTYPIAMSFVRCGAIRQAISFLNNGRFSAEERKILVSAIAHSFRENPRTCHSPKDLAVIIDELAVFYHSHVPPEHFRGRLEQLFVALSQRGKGSRLFPVVLSILKRSPNLFQPRFFARYCTVLIQHRQFSTVSKLLDAITTIHPKTARTLRILTDRSVVRTSAYRMHKRITPPRGPASLRLSSHLRHHPYAGLPFEISLQQLLISRRVLAAKRVFACAAAAMSSRRCTALGNILLHGVSRQPMSRNGRSVRKVVALLESLVKSHGFRPDRVTTNILIKTMVNWRSAFDSSRLRELFDQLVRGGYPAADYSPLHPPFATRQPQLSGSSGFPKLLPFISFEKHTRPLLKMFIKAFYLCNDVEAARKVVGILKVEEHKNSMAKKTRQRARSRGRIRAGQRNVTH